MRYFHPVCTDGHILWTLREDYHSKDSEYGLMEENLLAMERSGQCQVIKMGERFTDSHSGLKGLLYVVVKRVEASEFDGGENVPQSDVLPSILVDTVRETQATSEPVARGAVAHNVGQDYYAVGERVCEFE